jgi:hypothetical protein
MIARTIATLLPLLLATSAQAVQLHFEAWPTPSPETCPAPCYQMRMFLQVDPWDLAQQIGAIQMDVRVVEGAFPAQLASFPDRNANSDQGNVHSGNLPWNLTSAVARSPAMNFDARMVHAASSPFSVEGLADRVSDPATTCIDSRKCGFVEEALALNRVYLGFINVTRSTPPFEPGQPEAAPIFGAEFRPQGVPFFIVRVGNVAGTGDAVEALARYAGGDGFVLFMPEPSTALVLVLALTPMVARRVRA